MEAVCAREIAAVNMALGVACREGTCEAWAAYDIARKALEVADEKRLEKMSMAWRGYQPVS